MAALLARLAEARDGGFRAALLVGGPGAGKSAVLEALAEAAKEQGALALRAESSSAAESPKLMRRLLVQARALGKGAGEPTAGGGPLSAHEARELNMALKDLASERPVILLLDGGESFDAALAESLLETSHALSASPLLLVVAARWPLPADAGLAVLLRHLRLQGSISEVTLAPLDRAGSDRLVREVAGDMPAPPAFCESVHAVARGNPRFTVELVKAALGHARPRGLRLDDVDLAALPPTTALLERFSAALSTLTEEERRVADAAAAHGPRFGIKSLEIALGAPPGGLDAALERLARAGVLAKADGGRYAFSLPQLGTTIYDSLHEEPRRELHQRIARAIESLAEAGDERYLGDLGRHHALAGEYGKAYEAYHRAAERAEEVGDADGALQGFNLALKVLRASGETRDKEKEAALLHRLVELDGSFGLHEEAQRHYQVLIGLAGEMGRKQEEAEVYLGLGYALRRAGKALKALEAFTAAAERAGGEGAGPGAAGIRAEALRGAASAHFRLNDFAAALEAVQRSLEVPLGPEESVLRGKTLALAGSLYGILGRFREAESAYGGALELLEKKDPKEAARVLRLTAEVLLYEGQFEASLKVGERAQRAAEASGSEQVAATARVLRSEALIALGRTADAEVALKEVVDSKPRLGLAAQALLALVRGGLSTALGRYDEAVAHLGAALERARAASHLVYEAEAHYRTAIVYHFMGLEVRKRDSLQAAITTFKRIGNKHRVEQCRLWMKAQPMQSGAPE
jgi:tetratricopeptide (TPR) repeat protein